MQGKGPGLGCAQALLREGFNVLIVVRGDEMLTATATKLIADGVTPALAVVLFVNTDIITTEGRSAVFAVRKDFDMMVTNVGGAPPSDFRDWGRDVWIRADDADMLTPSSRSRRRRMAWQRAVLAASLTSPPAG